MKPPSYILPQIVQARIVPAPSKKGCLPCGGDTNFMIHVRETFTPICHECLGKAVTAVQPDKKAWRRGDEG